MAEYKHASEKCGYHVTTLYKRIKKHNITLEQAMEIQNTHGGVRRHKPSEKKFIGNALEKDINFNSAPKVDVTIARKYHSLKLLG